MVEDPCPAREGTRSVAASLIRHYAQSSAFKSFSKDAKRPRTEAMEHQKLGLAPIGNLFETRDADRSERTSSRGSESWQV